MQLAVVAYPPYRAGLGAGTLELEVPEGTTLREVLRRLAQHDEWLWGQLLVHVRGEMVRLDEELHDGDRLELLPPIAGGR
jgi:molybdopterin converting factor small subunit